MLTLTSISKRFATVSALSQVNLSCVGGQVHGLLGENGAGKSTLMHVLFGLVKPDSGSITIDGKQVDIQTPAQAQRYGIGMVHQHFALVPTLTVADNIILALQTALGRCDRATWAQRIRDRATKLQWDINPLAVVSSLSIGQQQRVEIMKALLALDNAVTTTRTLILDEPTAVLTDKEVDELLPAIRSLADDGVAVIFISHKLPEVARVCDVVTVLRRGAVVHHGSATISADQLATHMIGNALTARQRTPSPAVDTAPVLLSTENLCVRDAKGRDLLKDINLTVRAGEIVAVAGVEGNGQAALVQVLTGQTQPTHGKMHGQFNPQTGGYIPDDRHRDALVVAMSVRDNMMMKKYRHQPYSRWGWLSLATWKTQANSMMSSGDVRAAHADIPIATLSGGNQQKAVVVRELDDAPAIIIAVNPTRGLDVAAAQAVLDRLVAARDRGAAVVLVHHDLDEIMAVADRIVVMHQGRLLSSIWPIGGRQDIAQLMVGAPVTVAP